MDDLLVRYVHFIGIMLLSSALIVQNLFLAKEMSSTLFKKLVVIDGVYGVSATVIFVAGFLLWLSVGKPKEFYSSNPIFHAKLMIFVCVALLSIVPTVFFLRHRRQANIEVNSNILVPRYIIVIKRIELLLLLILPLLAVLMARGVGI